LIIFNVEAAGDPVGLADAAELEGAGEPGADAGELPHAANPPARMAGTTSAIAIERRRDLGFVVMELPWDSRQPESNPSASGFACGAERDQSSASPAPGTIPLAATFERWRAARPSGGCPYPRWRNG
jgi:hypothetical protein